MNRILILVLFAVLTLTGCRRDFYDNYGPPGPPTGITALSGDNSVEIFWNPSPEADVQGYNIYVSSTPNGRYELIGSTRATSYVDNGAVNGSDCYYAVSAYDYNGNESALSRYVAYAVPRPEGYGVRLSDYRTDSSYAGYEFPAYSVVAWNDRNCDMWYENYNGTLYMDVNTDTDIQDMGPTRSILDIAVAPSTGWSHSHDVQLTVGHTYVVWTFDDHYAKFRVSSLSLDHVVFDWAYQLQKSNPLLKRAVVGGADSRPVAKPHGHN